MKTTSPSRRPRAQKGPGRPRGGSEVREHLLQAAVAECRAEGVERARIGRIAAVAGVTRAAFYFHFPTKQDVLLELLRRYQERITRRIERDRPALRSLRSLLESIADEHFATAEETNDHGLWSEVLHLWPRLAQNSRELPVRDLVAQVIADTQGTEITRADLDPQDLAASVLVGLLGAIALSSVPGAGGRRRVQRIIDLLSDGATAARAESDQADRRDDAGLRRTSSR